MTENTQRTYQTSELAAILEIHPNTMRFYEDKGLIARPFRGRNGHRVFTSLHVEQLRMIRLALRTDLVWNGLRRLALSVPKACVKNDYSGAEIQMERYLSRIDSELKKAQRAWEIAENLGEEEKTAAKNWNLPRKKAAEDLGITIETLRSWETNGLLKVNRSPRGHRVYQGGDMLRLRVICALRMANCSLPEIRGLLEAQDSSRWEAVFRGLLNDLEALKKDALEMKARLSHMKEIYANIPQ